MLNIKAQKARYESGQAIVEYAIILILTVLLAIGGSELASAAYASSKASDAAKAAINEYVEIISNIPVGSNNIPALKRRIEDLELQLNAIETGDLNGNTINDNLENYLPTITDQDADDDVDLDDYLLVLASFGLDISPNDGVTTIEEVQVAADPVVKLKALILLAQIDILDTNQVGNTRLGDHENVDVASCGGAEGAYTYDYGLGDDRYVDPESYPTQAAAGNNNQIFLFNSKYIDVQSCSGVDSQRGGVSRLDILVNGYVIADDPGTVDDERLLNEPGLPKLNQTMQSLYTKVCIAIIGGQREYVGCNKAHTEELLKAPGKLCSPDLDSCNVDNPLADSPGYYFWGESDYSGAPSFRPTFQISCNGTSHDSAELMDAECLNSEVTKIEVNTRYRSVFESFLTLGLKELTNLSNLQFFHNPNNVGVAGSNQLVGTVGSEIGPVGSTQLPTVKYFRDFRGCYSLNVATNSVSACN